MKILTYEEAVEFLKDVPVKPKASKHATKGSNYDFLYRAFPYYISHGVCVKLLMGGKDTYTCREEMFSKLGLKEPK